MTNSYTTPWWAKNAHIQTILPVLTKIKKIPLIRERQELDDGDFIDLDWLRMPNNGEPILVILHGLEGSADSHYVRRLLRDSALNKIAAVVHHHRGCSGEDNRLLRSYHSGDTDDIAYTLAQLQSRYPQSALYAVGYSLGGNVLAKYQGEFTHNSLLTRAVVVSAPLDLASSGKRLENGFSRFYQYYLLRQLRQKMGDKLKKHQTLLPVSLKSMTTFYQFDDSITAPIHGFNNADDYYRQASALPLLNKITKPTLIIHAADDPFLSDAVIPTPDQLSPAITYELNKNGGHVGFINAGSLWKPKFYLEARILQYLFT